MWRVKEKLETWFSYIPRDVWMAIQPRNGLGKEILMSGKYASASEEDTG